MTVKSSIKKTVRKPTSQNRLSFIRSRKSEVLRKSRSARPKKGYDTLELQAIIELCRDLIAPAQLEEIANKVLETAKRLTGSRLGYVGHIDPENGSLVCPTMTKDMWQKCKVHEKSVIFKKFGDFWGWVLEHRRPLMSNSPEKDERFKVAPNGHVPIHSFLSVPALYDRKIVGQIALANSLRPYTSVDLETVQRLADLFATAVHREQSREQLERAYFDFERQAKERTSKLNNATHQLRQQQKILQESEERYRTVVGDQTEVICRIRADGTFTFVNDVYCRFFAKTSQQLVGHKWQPMALPEDLPMIETKLRALSPASPVAEIENRVISGRGQVRWMQIVNRGFFNKKGKLVEIQCVGRDVTNRRRAEEALRESEKRYRSLFENSLDGIFTTKSDGTILDANPAACAMLGMSKKEVCRAGRAGIVEPNANLEAALELRERTGKAIAELTYVRKDGTKFLGDTSFAIIDDGLGSVSFFVIVRDITERKQAEEALFAYEHIVSSSADGMSLVGTDYKYKIVNDTYLRRFILPRDKIVGHHVSEIMGREVFDTVIKPQFDNCLSGQVVVHSDWYSYPVLGRRYREVSYSPCRNRNRAIIGIVVNVRDTTERKLAEDAHRKNEELLNATQRLSKIGGWEWDVEKQTKVWTEETYRIHELEPGELTPGSAEHMAQSLACYDEQDRPAISQAFRRCAEEGVPYDLEFPFTTAKGHRKWIRTTAQAVYNSGRIARVVGNIVDRTEHKRSEEMLQARLRLSESAGVLSLDELLQKALDEAEQLTESRIGFIHFLAEDQKTLSLQMWSTNTLQNMRTAEGKGCHYSVDEAGVWVDCIRKRSPIIYNDYAALAHRKGMPAGHAPVIRELVLPVQRENRIVAVLGVGNKEQDYNENDVEITSTLANLVWDIVLRKKAEEQVLLQGLVLDQARDWIAITDLKGVIRYTNRAKCAALQRRYEELIGKHITVCGEDPHRGVSQQQIIDTTLANGEWRGEVTNLAADGSEHVVDCRTFLVQDRNGKALALCGIGTDISERKKAEEEVRDSRTKLQAMYRDLQNAREKERRRIAREIHDEMGQNLTALKIDLAWMKKKIKAGQAPLIRKIEAMDRIVEQTIEVVRRVSSDLRPGMLDSLGLSAAVEWFVREFEQRTEIKCELLIEPEEIKPDPALATELFRILQETLTNAARHSKASSIFVSLKQTGDNLQLMVIDNGMGIPDAKLADPGSFGLLGIRERVLALNGDLSIKGLEGEGTTVRLTVPNREQGE